MAFNQGVITMKNTMLIILLTFFSLPTWSQEVEKDMIFCKLERNSKIEAKITKTNDELYSFYVMNLSQNKWTKVMDLGEPVVWTKNGVGEIADFYSADSYNYWVRLFFNNKYDSLGHGEFILPKYDEEEQELRMDLTEAHGLVECTGTLK